MKFSPYFSSLASLPPDFRLPQKLYEVPLKWCAFSVMLTQLCIQMYTLILKSLASLHMNLCIQPYIIIAFLIEILD